MVQITARSATTRCTAATSRASSRRRSFTVQGRTRRTDGAAIVRPQRVPPSDRTTGRFTRSPRSTNAREFSIFTISSTATAPGFIAPCRCNEVLLRLVSPRASRRDHVTSCGYPPPSSTFNTDPPPTRYRINFPRTTRRRTRSPCSEWQ